MKISSRPCCTASHITPATRSAGIGRGWDLVYGAPRRAKNGVSATPMTTWVTPAAGQHLRQQQPDEVDRGYQVDHEDLLHPVRRHGGETLRRLTRLGTPLVPGAVAVAVTIATDHGALNFAASDPRLDDLHDLQFNGGAGPVVAALGHNEPERSPCTGTPRACSAARRTTSPCCSPPVQSLGRPLPRVTAHSSSMAWTKAWGRFPRS